MVTLVTSVCEVATGVVVRGMAADCSVEGLTGDAVLGEETALGLLVAGTLLELTEVSDGGAGPPVERETEHWVLWTMVQWFIE